MGRADKSAQVTKAVLIIRSGEYIDYSNAAKKFYYSHMAVIRRIKGLTKTRQEANSFYYQCLTNNQEEVLISRINKLIDQGLPSTSYIIRNLAEEIRGEYIGKN
jgi:uncharacterized protein YoaH (UPF0181 family)